MARPDISKMVLAAAARGETRRAHAAATDELLERGMPNVVGVAEGIKWRNGEPTGEPALVVLVAAKVSQAQLSPSEVVPGQISGMQTDVLEVGPVFAGGGVIRAAGVQTLAKRVRPAQGGYSVGHK